MFASVRWTLLWVLFGALLGGCGNDGAANGTAGTGGSRTQSCGADATCETEGLVCDVARNRCVECLAADDCDEGSKTCIDGTCQERLCSDDADCPSGTHECTDTGCAPCSGEVVAADAQEGECFAARGPGGTSPRDPDINKPDGCSAELFVSVLEDAGYDVPADDPERQNVADNPLKRVSEGLCSAQFGNRGNAVSACELHDYCYSICGSSQLQCDLEFFSRLLDTCAANYPPRTPCRISCDALAAIYGTGAAAKGTTPYLNAQGRQNEVDGEIKRNCSCCPDRTSDGVCDESSGETVDNSSDCTGDFPNGADCLMSKDCSSGYCSVHGECAPLLCITNDDCPSDICNWGLCLARPLEAGSGCSTDEACVSGECRLGVCIECGRDDDCSPEQHCNLVGDCIDDLGNNAICTANAECLSGICSVGFCAECVRDSQCIASQHCNLVGDCVDDRGNNAVCTADAECRSGICSVGFCAECVRDSQCVESQHCNLFGDCINDLGNGNPCTSNAECISGICRGLCSPA